MQQTPPIDSIYKRRVLYNLHGLLLLTLTVSFVPFMVDVSTWGSLPTYEYNLATRPKPPTNPTIELEGLGVLGSTEMPGLLNRNGDVGRLIQQEVLSTLCDTPFHFFSIRPSDPQQRRIVAFNRARIVKFGSCNSIRRFLCSSVDVASVRFLHVAIMFPDPIISTAVKSMTALSQLFITLPAYHWDSTVWNEVSSPTVKVLRVVIPRMMNRQSLPILLSMADNFPGLKALVLYCEGPFSRPQGTRKDVDEFFRNLTPLCPQTVDFIVVFQGSSAVYDFPPCRSRYHQTREDIDFEDVILYWSRGEGGQWNFLDRSKDNFHLIWEISYLSWEAVMMRYEYAEYHRAQQALPWEEQTLNSFSSGFSTPL